MSSVRLFVLGLVYEHDTHGYEIKEVARLWGIESWASIGFGSIYHALGKLQEESLIEERNVEQDAGRPSRFVYRITNAGRESFLTLLRETCRTAGTERREIDIALAFIADLPPQERVSLLTERQEKLEHARALSSEGLAYLQGREAQIPWVFASVRHSQGRQDWEIRWNRHLVETVAEWPKRQW